MSRRSLALVVIAVGACFSLWHFAGRSGGGNPLGSGSANASARFARAVDPVSLLAAINAVRVSRGLKPLLYSRQLSLAATQHSREMGDRGYFAHNSADGTVFWRRILRFFPDRGYHNWDVGENLAWHASAVTPSDLITAWMNSPEHRQNLLAGAWRVAGIGSAQVPAAPGFYEGVDVAIVTVDFGERSR